MGEAKSGPRVAALVGPYLSGKTSLMEALLFAAGALARKGTAKERNTVGDASAEARDRQMSVELSLASCQFLGEDWTLIDCPGSIEFAQEAHNALLVADAAVVVCEPAPEKAQALAPLLRFLDAHAIPHVIFVNKTDAHAPDLPALMEALQAASERPLVMRQVPLRDGEKLTGFVDLISERAYRYKPGGPSALMQLPDAAKGDEQEARQALLEKLADFDDALMEQLLEDAVPEPRAIFGYYAHSLAEDRIVPVMLGSAEQQRGIVRLWKTLRHDLPGVAHTAELRGFADGGDAVLQVFKTMYVPHTGKLSLARVWSGEIADNFAIAGARIGGLLRLFGAKHDKVARARRGDVVALGRLEGVKTGDVLTKAGRGEAGEPWPAPLPPVYAAAIQPEKREDEVKMTASLARLIEEDPSYQFKHSPDTGELQLWGQGEIHLMVALLRLHSRYNVSVKRSKPQVAYKETITKPVQQHARHKKQSGGHGQFGDVHVTIKPRARGEGFVFTESVVGGAVPRNLIPSVETGVRDYLARGPLGFPVVDVAVDLFDGQYHAVDSSDMAFRTAAQLAMREGMPKCGPVLLEPVYKVSIDSPAEYTGKLTNLVIGRRGQILGFEAKEGWSGWDTLQAYLPEAEMHDLIVELRSLSQGTGSFRFAFDHLAELSGRIADQVITHRAQNMRAA